MIYETPEVTALTPAINAIQGNGPVKISPVGLDSMHEEGIAAYQDWE